MPPPRRTVLETPPLGACARSPTRAWIDPMASSSSTCLFLIKPAVGTCPAVVSAFGLLVFHWSCASG